MESVIKSIVSETDEVSAARAENIRVEIEIIRKRIKLEEDRLELEFKREEREAKRDDPTSGWEWAVTPA